MNFDIRSVSQPEGWQPNEYQRTLLERLGTQDPAAVQSETPTAIRVLIVEAGDDLRTRPEKTEWSAYLCIAHIVDAELVLAGRYRWILAHDQPDIEPTEALARALTQEGYAASVRTGPVGEQLCQQHCPVSHVAHEFPQLCEAETEMFGKILGRHVQRLATIAHGDGVCTTCIPGPVSTSSTTGAPRSTTGAPRSTTGSQRSTTGSRHSTTGSPRSTTTKETVST